MAKFTYGGYTFEPRGTFEKYGFNPGKEEFTSISHQLFSINYGKVADGDLTYSYNAFYKAAGDCADDVFYCEETKELYVPCGNALMIFDTNRNATTEEVEKRFEIRKLMKEPLWQNVHTYGNEPSDMGVQKIADELTCKVLSDKYGRLFDLYDNIEDNEDINHDWEWLNEKFYKIIDEFTN